MKFATILSTCLVLLPSAAFAQSTTLTGDWKFTVPNGGVRYLQLSQKGDEVTGSTLGSRPQLLVGTLRGGKLHLEGTVAPPNGRPRAVFDATVQGERFPISGTVPNGETASGFLERASPEEATPARLPLPDLRDLPDNGLARTPPMGWNSWNRFHDHFDDATVRQMADALVASGMKDAGYNYVVVDEGWSSYRDKNGKITGNARFPDMKALAEYVHSKGLRIGIYSSPGPQVCGGYQGSYGHEEEDARTFAEWGYDYLKYDWCSASAIYQPTRADLEGAYQKMGEALQKTGRPMVFSLCEYGLGDVWNWAAKSGGNLWRTTHDIADNWTSMERIGFAQLEITDAPQPGHWNDPDMLEVGNGGMTGDEYRTHMTLWSMLRAPLIAGNDLRTMTDETKSILMNRDVVAIDQDPEALPVQLLFTNGETEVLVRPLAGNSVAVALFNRGNQPADISFLWDTLHLGAVLGGKTLKARDLWKHQDVPVEGDSFNATVPKHGVVLLRVTAEVTR